MVKQLITPLKNSVRQTHLSRLYFLSKGCKQVPLELTGGKVLWANPDEGYFMSAHGVKQKPSLAPSKSKKGCKAYNGKRGLVHPCMRHFGNQGAHRVMFATFAEEPCPIFFDSKGNPYKGIVHHVIENPYDIRMDNLMGWLTYREHKIADKRRRALEAVVPDGDLTLIPYDRLRQLQDPRVLTDEQFQAELDYMKEELKKHPLVHVDPLAAAAEEPGRDYDIFVERD